ncbi:hypothetical protein ANN_21467 [Periplaneta americana]|uniref:Uncharacterized protein n=1 Tax=Periplaneta americana TaxID=6978 RepID=A0ABQ8SFQ5_PERAM|nr:hypothetical protein ANN_21467 [Periplaneta americana]
MALSPVDYPARVRFCQWFLQQCGVNPNFSALVLFTDEAQFTQDGITNFHNQHVWAYENPRATVPSHHQVRFSLNMWACIIGDRLNDIMCMDGESPSSKRKCTSCATRVGSIRSLPPKETLKGHSDSSFPGEGYIHCCVGVRLCDMYSNQELAEIHFMNGKADGNAALARRLYQERYPQRQCPDRKTFVQLP